MLSVKKKKEREAFSVRQPWRLFQVNTWMFKEQKEELGEVEI